MWKGFANVIAVTAVLAMSARGQDSVSCKQTDEILAQLRELRMVVESLVNSGSVTQGVQRTAQAQIALRPTRVDTGNNPFLGSKDATLTIVEFADFQCPYCNQFFVQTFPELKKNYIDSGRVRFYSMDFPLDIHGNALQAAQAGRCAGEQGQFRPMHDRMQRNPEELDLAKLVE